MTRNDTNVGLSVGPTHRPLPWFLGASLLALAIGGSYRFAKGLSSAQLRAIADDMNAHVERAVEAEVITEEDAAKASKVWRILREAAK